MSDMILINRTKVNRDLWTDLKYKAPLVGKTHEELLNIILAAGLKNIKVKVEVNGK